MNLNDLIKHLRSLEAKATPGPWDRHERNSNYPDSVVVESSRLRIASVHTAADIDLIAEARALLKKWEDGK